MVFSPLYLRWNFLHEQKPRFVKSALKKDSEEEKKFHKNVKREMNVIVGLLRVRVDVEKEPSMKKQWVQGYKKNNHI